MTSQLTRKAPRTQRWFAGTLIALVALLPAATSAQIHDNANLFSDAAKQQALQAIAQLRHQPIEATAGAGRDRQGGEDANTRSMRESAVACGCRSAAA